MNVASVTDEVVAAIRSHDADRRLAAAERLGRFVALRIAEATASHMSSVAAAAAPSLPPATGDEDDVANASASPTVEADAAPPTSASTSERRLATVVVGTERVQVPVVRPLGSNGAWSVDTSQLRADLAALPSQERGSG
jgi:hypothetical protein